MKNKELLAELIASGLTTLTLVLILVYVPGVFEFYSSLISKLQDGSPFLVVSGLCIGISISTLLSYPLLNVLKNKYNMK